MNKPLAAVGDVVAPVLIAGSWLGYLSEIAAVIAIIWYILQFVLAIPDLIKIWVKFSTWLKKKGDAPPP